MSDKTTTTTRIVAAGLALLMTASALAFTPAALAQTSPETIEVTTSELPNGLSGANVTVAVEDASATSVTDVSVSSRFNLSSSEIADDNASATFKLVDLNDTVKSGNSSVTLATVTVQSSSDDPSLTVTDKNVDDDNGNTVDALQVGGSAPTSNLTLGGNSINDVDGDDKYEDLDGNGKFNFKDVITLVFEFREVDGPELTNALDFNDDDKVNFADVIELVFKLIQAR